MAAAMPSGSAGAAAQRDAASPDSAKGAMAGGQHIRVQSVKMVSANCP
jgi:hypothetical protein